MVYNPPKLRDDEQHAEPPPVIEVSPLRSKDAYMEQARRAVAWVSILFIVWLWQRLLCYLDLPPHCDFPTTALEVLTDLLVLLSLGITQVLSDPQKRELYDQIGETGMLMMEDPFAAKDALTERWIARNRGVS